MSRRIPGLLLAIALGAASCSGESVERPPPAPVAWASLDAKPVVDAGAGILTAKERELPNDYCGAIASQGFDAIAPLLYEDADFSSPDLGTAHGREQIVRAHDLLLGAFDRRTMALDRVWRTPSEQTIEWIFTGVQARDWMGVPATGKPVAFKGVTLLWTRDDGSIADIHMVFDAAVVKAQLGTGPKELRALAPPAAPAGPAQVFDQTQAGSADESAGVKVVQSALDALENQDENAYVGAMADDVEVYTGDRAAPFRGKADAKSYYAAIHKAIGQLDTTVTNAWGVSDFAIVEYSIAGEMLGALRGIPFERDKVIRFELVDICEIRDRHIVRLWRYDDPSQILD